MEPWTRVMAKLTEHKTYRIDDRGYDWWHVLACHHFYDGDTPMVAALVAQVRPGARRYKLQAGGKDARVWDLITANIPASMEGYGVKGNRFEWGRLSMGWIYYRNAIGEPSRMMRLIGEL